MVNRHSNLKQKPAVKAVPEKLIQIREYLKYGSILFLICLAVFGATLGFDYIILDDPVHILENPLLRTLSWEAVLKIWNAPYFGFYIPVTYSIWLLWTQFLQFIFFNPPVYPLPPQIYHGFNLLWHILNSFMVFLILSQILGVHSKLSPHQGSKKSLHAFIGALFFAIHPLQVETVSWISEFKDLCSTFFSLTSIFTFLRLQSVERKGEFLKKQSKFSKTLPFLFFILAILSKPSAAILPLFIWILNRFTLDKPIRESFKTPVIWFFISFPILFLTKTLQQDVNIEEIAPLWARPWIAIDSLCFYLYQVVWPQHLGVDYSRAPHFVMSHKLLLLEFLLPILFLSVFFKWKKKNFTPLTGLLLFFCGFIPVSGLIPFAFQSFSSVADHYSYFPLFGFSLAISSLLDQLNQTFLPKFRQIQIGILMICFAMGLALGVRSFYQVTYWRNSVTLLRHTLEFNEKSYLSHFNLASPLMQMGDPQGSLNELRAALAIRPDYIPAQLGLALRYKNDHQCSQSISMVKEVIQAHSEPQGAKLRSMLAGAHTILSLCYSELGQTQEAERSMSQARLLQHQVHEEDRSF